LDKVLGVKTEIMLAYYERAKNSQSFFRNLMESIDNTMNYIHEGTGFGGSES
jgi:hypothetical protein